MSLTSTTQINLTYLPNRLEILSSTHSSENPLHNHVLDEPEPINSVEAIPDGGKGWGVVFALFTFTFWFSGHTSCWGVIQANLLYSSSLKIDPSTISFVGSLALACMVSFGLLSVRFTRVVGARMTSLLGVLLLASGVLLSSFTTDNIGGLFCTSGAMTGIGACLLYTTSNAVPVQWFSSKLGTANGIVKLGGGLGAAVLSISEQALIDKVGIPWTFRIIGLLILATSIPAVFLVKERAPGGHTPFIDLNLFKNGTYSLLFLAGAIGTFALFVPPYFLPLFARSIGLSAATGAWLVAGFSLCSAVGRLAAGYACDRFGSMNMLLLTMFVNAASMLAIWPVSSSLAPLVVFAAINGIANGSFFVVMPTAVANLIGPGMAAVAMGMAITGWTGGYLMGSPVAGALITATGAQKSSSVAPYRAAIFYAGGVALAASACVLVARYRLDRNMLKKL